MSSRKRLLIKVISVLFSFFAAVTMNYFVTSEVESRLEIYSPAAQIILLVAQLIAIYVISQQILFKKLTRLEIFLLSVTYAATVISVLFLRYASYAMQFHSSTPFQPWRFCWNPISFLFDAAEDQPSILVSLLNLFLFLPLKPILAANKLHPKWQAVIAGFAAVELMQSILQAGFFDLGDIVLYFAGYLAGAGILRLYLDYEKKAHPSDLPGLQINRKHDSEDTAT